MKQLPPDYEPACPGRDGHDWRESDELYCETCGWGHWGLICRECLETVDLVYYADPREP